MSQQPKATLYAAPLVIPVTGPVICGGAVAVRDGRILHVGTRDWVEQKLTEDGLAPQQVDVRPWRGLVTPGLVNAHTHLQYTGMASVGSREYPSFRAWELAFNKIYDSPEQKPWRAWSHEGARQMVEAGITAAADVVSDVEAADALLSQGLHGIAYWEVMDWDNEDWKQHGKEALLAHIAEIRKMGVTELGISPHAPYSLGSGPLLDLPDIARQLGMRLHIHLGETPAEAGHLPSRLTNQTSWAWNRTEWQSFNDLKRAGAGASAIQFLDQLAVLGPDVHIAHGVHASREDRRILRQRGVSVALCPRSNRVTCTGADAPVARYLEEGNPLCVGTDSLSSCPSLDVLDDVAMLYDIAIAQGYEGPDLSHRLIRMMTLGGAEAMGLNCGPKRIGQINVGAQADLAFFDVPVDVSSPQALEDTMERFVRHGSGTCRATIIEGRVAYDRIWN
ncbi:MAG: amidohydrolase family protein [Olsenella sp.]|jgi:cytosine/adenosine deaminase-related metal-dependent hydrolase|nr:amidohydrolase family protein [Olsenella sp.]MCI1289471.1 amidohydrolase family protein [Olsenella sp.]